ncbi:MAG: hypothetical protein L3J93_03645 [Thermoplasmata archaeon]|nr:hypothetical protein [Thermoplasmata archaeon]
MVAHRPYLIVGPSGTGKTKLALQFLCDGARRGEKVLLVTLEEPPNEMRINHHALLPDLDRVFVFDAIPDVMRYERTPFKDIAAVRSSIAFSEVQPTIRKTPELVSVEVTFSALEQTLKTEMARRNYTRLVVDSLTALQYFCMKGLDEVVGAQTFLRFLSDLGVTTLLTVEAPVEDVEMAERLLARGEIRLFRWELEETTVRAIGVEKFRGSAHDIRLHPYRMSPSGIDINLEQTISRDSHMVVTPFLRAEGAVTESIGLIADASPPVPTPSPPTLAVEHPVPPTAPALEPALASPLPPQGTPPAPELRDDRTAIHLERARAAVAEIGRTSADSAPRGPEGDRASAGPRAPSPPSPRLPAPPSSTEPLPAPPAPPQQELPAPTDRGAPHKEDLPTPHGESTAGESRPLPPVRARSAPQRPPLPARRVAPVPQRGPPAPTARRATREPAVAPRPAAQARPTSPSEVPPAAAPVEAPSSPPIATPEVPKPVEVTPSAAPPAPTPLEAPADPGPPIRSVPPGGSYPPPSVVRVAPPATPGAPETRRRGGAGGRKRQEVPADGTPVTPRPKRKPPTRRKAPTVTSAQAGAPPPEAARVEEAPPRDTTTTEPAKPHEPKESVAPGPSEGGDGPSDAPAS